MEDLIIEQTTDYIINILSPNLASLCNKKNDIIHVNDVIQIHIKCALHPEVGDWWGNTQGLKWPYINIQGCLTDHFQLNFLQNTETTYCTYCTHVCGWEDSVLTKCPEYMVTGHTVESCSV